LPGVEICPDCDLALVDAMPPESPDADPEGDMVEICTVAGDAEALVIKGLLDSEGITCSLSSDIPHSVVPLEVDGLGAVRISVLDADADRAASIIAQHGE
jgi:hypothetical protein